MPIQRFTAAGNFSSEIVEVYGSWDSLGRFIGLFYNACKAAGAEAFWNAMINVLLQEVLDGGEVIVRVEGKTVDGTVLTLYGAIKDRVVLDELHETKSAAVDYVNRLGGSHGL